MSDTEQLSLLHSPVHQQDRYLFDLIVPVAFP